jgi:hypothetical protein
MIKIKVSAPWDTPENALKRLLKQFKTRETDLNGIEFVFDDSYDIVIFFNYINLEVPNHKKVYVFPHEPVWSGSHQTTFTSSNNITVLGFDQKYYSPQDICKPTLAHTFYGGRGPWADSLEDWNYSNLINISPTKFNKISSIVTNLNKDDYIDDGCSYNPRYNLTQHLINQAPFVDFYGGWELKKSTLKKDAVESYMFTIGIENQFTANWITEKFYDSILYNSIPIYYGCTNIKEYYPENGYILIEDPFDLERTTNQIREINDNAEEIYSELLPGLLQIKERYFKEFNLLHKIIELAKNGI